MSERNTEELIEEIREATVIINNRLPELIGRGEYFYFKNIKNGRLDISPVNAIYFERLHHKEVFKTKNNKEHHGN